MSGLKVGAATKRAGCAAGRELWGTYRRTYRRARTGRTS